jgi:hypothetical protein
LENGASGQCYRASVLEVLKKRQKSARTVDGWKIAFHQGTIVDPW